MKQRSRFKAFNHAMMLQFSLGLFIFVGILSASFLMNGNQDNRSEAMSSSGVVQLRPILSSGRQYFTVQELNNLSFQLNTNNTKVTSLNLTFGVQSSVLNTLSANQVTLFANDRWVVVGKTVTPVSGGYVVRLALKAKNTSVSTSSYTPLFQLALTPVKAGSITVAFDKSRSVALDTNNRDVLKSMDPFSFSVQRSSTPIGYPTTQVTPRPTAVPLNVQDDGRRQFDYQPEPTGIIIPF